MTSVESVGPYQQADKRSELDIWLVISALRRRLPIFLAIVIVFLLAAYGFTTLQAPSYTASVSILIDPRHKEVLEKNEDVLSDLPIESNMAIDTEVKVMTSPEIARRVVDKLNLKSLPEFASNSTPPEDILLGDITAERAGQTYVIDLSVETDSPQLSAKIAQAYADAYVGKQLQDKMDANQSAVDWLNDRLDTLRSQVEADDTAVQTYKIAHDLMSAEGATMAEQEVSALNQQMAGARADLSEKRARRDAAVAHVGDNDVVESLSTDLVRSLRKQRSDVVAELAKLQANYGPRHPDVVKDQHQIAEIDAQLAAENQRTIASLNAEVRIAEQRYDSLMGSRSDASTSLRSNNSAEVGLLELQRKADASHAIYESFLNRSHEVTAQIGLQQAEASVITKARVPNAPSSPNMKLNLAMGLLGGLLIGGAWVGVAEFLDQTYKSGREVVDDLALKNLVSIPLIDTRGAKNSLSVITHVLDKPYSLFSEAIRSLRTQIALAGRVNPVKVIAITSALPQEGKTVTSISLARSMAANGSRVLLIDADMRRLSLTKYMDVTPQYGLQDVFDKPSLISESILVDEVSGANMILVPRTRSISTEVFTNAYFEKMIYRLRDAYDYIILDTAPVLALSDIRVISSVSDAVLLVVRWNKTPKDAVVLAKSILAESEANVLGVCLNQVDTKSPAAHGYGDAIHYFNDFKEYWSDTDA